MQNGGNFPIIPKDFDGGNLYHALNIGVCVLSFDKINFKFGICKTFIITLPAKSYPIDFVYAEANQSNAFHMQCSIRFWAIFFVTVGKISVIVKYFRFSSILTALCVIISSQFLWSLFQFLSFDPLKRQVSKLRDHKERRLSACFQRSMLEFWFFKELK